MTTAAIESEPQAASEPRPAQPDASVHSLSDRLSDPQARLVEDVRVERVVLRKAIVGALIGAAICAPLYVGLVWLALRNSGTALGPAIGIAVGLGLYAGLFLGGSTGTLIGAKTLEHYEHDALPSLPTEQQ
jgi:sulfite exporter TauE/SafE